MLATYCSRLRVSKKARELLWKRVTITTSITSKMIWIQTRCATVVIKWLHCQFISVVTVTSTFPAYTMGTKFTPYSCYTSVWSPCHRYVGWNLKGSHRYVGWNLKGSQCYCMKKQTDPLQIHHSKCTVTFYFCKLWTFVLQGVHITHSLTKSPQLILCHFSNLLKYWNKHKMSFSEYKRH